MDKKVPISINVSRPLFEDLRKSCITNSRSMKEQIIMILKTYYGYKD